MLHVYGELWICHLWNLWPDENVQKDLKNIVHVEDVYKMNKPWQLYICLF